MHIRQEEEFERGGEEEREDSLVPLFLLGVAICVHMSGSCHVNSWLFDDIGQH